MFVLFTKVTLTLRFVSEHVYAAVTFNHNSNLILCLTQTKGFASFLKTKIAILFEEEDTLLATFDPSSSKEQWAAIVQRPGTRS